MTDFRRLIELLTDAEVEFIIVGGVAVIAHGYSRSWNFRREAVGRGKDLADLEAIRELKKRRS